MFKSRPGQLFYQFLRVDAFDIILIVISVYARKRHHKAWWRNGSASDSSSEVRVQITSGSTILSVFTSREIISVVISVHARKSNKAWWRKGSASDSSSEGCVFKSRPGQRFISFYE